MGTGWPPGPAPVRVLLAAVGGYGHHYFRALLDEVPPGRATLAGVVDPLAAQSPAWPEISAAGVPVVGDIDGFFAAGHQADLTVVASPIHFHVPQSAAALAAGSHVLCEKPVGATLPDVDRLVGARDRAGRFVMIGYQWSFSEAIRRLKRDLLEGRYGRPLRLATLCAWPRRAAYYGRNTWAGRLRERDTGAWVLDSPANNAMAHFLHNALFLLGPGPGRSAVPVSLTAELARAYPIESADTVAGRIVTDGGCEVLFLASHVTEHVVAPCFRLDCERGVVTFGGTAPRIVGTAAGGQESDYGDPDATPQFQKLFLALERVGTPGAEVCGIEAAAAQTVCVTAMHESAAEIVPFPRVLRRGRPEDRVHVAGLEDQLRRCYRSGVLPSEIGCTWAVAGRPVTPTLPACFLADAPALAPGPGRSPW